MKQLVGREAELERLGELLARPVWVTLLGLPGVGKTALARAAVAAAEGRARVALADEPDLEETRRLRALAAEGCAVLAVARAPFGVEGEHVVRVAPLAVPAPSASAAEILSSPAVRLLADAAARAGAPLGPLEPIAPRLAEIARRTSGLPLAIELVAASLPLVPLDAVAPMLRRPGSLSAPTGIDRPRRHASLSDAVGPAIDALSPPARALLVRAAPYATGRAIDPREALAELRELIDAGFVEPAMGSHGPRYRVPALIGALALERAAPAEAERARRDHAREIAGELRALSATLWRTASPEVAARIASLGAEVEVLLEHAAADPELAPLAVGAALDHGSAAGAPSAALLARLDAVAAPSPHEALVRLAIEQATLAEREGRGEDARVHLERAARLASELDDAARARVALARGLHAREVHRDYDAARAAFDEAARTGDAATRVRALLAAGGAAAWAEQYGDAIRAIEGASRELRGMDAPRLAAVAATNLAIAWIGHWPGPELDPPRTRFLEDTRAAAATFEGIGDARSAGVALQAVALTLTTMLRFDEAKRALHAMRERSEAAGDRRFVVLADVNLADVATALGELDEGADALARAADGALRLDDRLLASVTAGAEGDLAWERGELGRARDAFGRARRMLEHDGEHASRLALVLAQQAALSPEAIAPSLIERAGALAGDDANVHRHAVRAYAALLARRRGRPDEQAEEAHVLPWLRAWVALAREAPERRGASGYGVPYALLLAARRFVRELDPSARRAVLERAYGLDAPAGPTLLLDLDRRSVRTPDGEWIELSRREKPFALLAALAAEPWARERVFDVSTLIERVWAGEKMRPDAGANRVYAAMAALRKQRGLRDLVQSDGDGYRLAPELEVLVFRERVSG